MNPINQPLFHSQPTPAARPRRRSLIPLFACLCAWLLLVQVGCQVGTQECKTNADCTPPKTCSSGFCLDSPSQESGVSTGERKQEKPQPREATLSQETTPDAGQPDTAKPDVLSPDTEETGPEPADIDDGGTIDENTEAPPEQEPESSGRDNSTCSQGETKACYQGPSGTQGQGECQAGQQVCTDKGLWGPCVGETTPKAESCDGKDNNCDGQVDEGCKCVTGETQNCGSDVGLCQKGTQRCEGGKWGECKKSVKPAVEICDNKDNDCDGQTDEQLSQVCRTACGEGVQSCNAGLWDACSATQPKIETCDGKDNDCDGQIDEGCQCKNGSKRSCGKSTGECKVGTQVCESGKWGLCKNDTKPTPELCDGKDNDCDGKIDESISKSCSTACGKGTQRCSAGKFGACSARAPKTETCDGVDNDCDGQTDEGCQCKNGSKRSCGTSRGECKTGTQSCVNGKWASCVGSLGPKTEICDGKDNDCDGKIDESISKLCSTACGKGTQRCSAGKFGACSARVPKTETCDGVDNDCDGKIDEGCQCKNGSKRICGTSRGECKAGTQSCVNGKWASCIGSLGPKTEVCDNKDNDCDGKVDESVIIGCSTVCGKGTRRCSAGKFGACSARTPSTEKCDGIDNDCDGKIDEGTTQLCRSACGRGSLICSKGKYLPCNARRPTTEKCDGVDNDCDGKVDESSSLSCSTACGKGYRYCISGKLGSCTARKPTTEICNGRDDDCDGKTDESTSAKCSSKCGIGYRYCISGKLSNCTARQPTTEVCNGRDDDCDGSTDEGSYGSCTVYVGRICYRGYFVCLSGKKSCRNINIRCSGGPIPR